MRRTILFSRPTLLLSLVIQIVASLLLWLSDIPTAGQVHAASSITQTTGPGDLGTIVTPTGNVYGITEGTPVGNNLFHSFAQFSVGTGDIAQFQTTTLLPNPAIHNILGRVTGQTPSSIFGTIDSASYYPGANLFLMNPNGIIFGPTASLNVGGMATFTTANYLRLTDTQIIHADPAATSVLTNAPVAAFGFLGSNSAAISVQGSTLEVGSGQSISLVGGNHGFDYTNPDTRISASVPGGVTVTGGKLLARGGQVNMASVASRGEISAGTLEQTNGQSFGALGTIRVSEQSAINVSGKGGGTVLIRGGHFVINDSTIISANVTGPGPVTNGVESIGGGIDILVSQDALIQNLAVIETNVAGNATPGIQYGGVNITAGYIEIGGVLDPELFPFTGIKSDVIHGSTGGHSGNVELKADSILGKDLGQIETLTGGAGNAGSIKLTATQDIDLNTALIQSSSADAAGNAGNISLLSASGNISMTTFTSVTSQASISNGQAGAITLSAPTGNILLDQASVFNQSFNAGPIGGIELTAKNLDLKEASSISGDNLTTLTAGNISVTLSNRLSLNDKSSIQTVARGPAAAADLTIRARTVNVVGGSLLTTETFGSGPGGQLSITAENLQLTTGGTISAETSGTAPSAIGGSITVTTTDHVTMTGEASITASSTGPGDAGDISINAGQQLDLMGQSSITAKATQAGGGNIDIRAVDRVRLINSEVSSSVQGGASTAGGNITIDPNVIVLQDSSNVTATAVRGAGGSITLTTPLFLKDSSSQVSASSEFGLNGTVTIQSPTSNLSGSLGPLTSTPSQAQALLTQRCAALASGQASSFVVAGREQLPSDPGGWLSSPLAFTVSGENHDAGYTVASSPATMPIASHDTGTVSLRRLTPAGFLMANFSDSEATGCRS